MSVKCAVCDSKKNTLSVTISKLHLLRVTSSRSLGNKTLFSRDNDILKKQ